VLGQDGVSGGRDRRLAFSAEFWCYPLPAFRRLGVLVDRCFRISACRGLDVLLVRTGIVAGGAGTGRLGVQAFCITGI